MQTNSSSLAEGSNRDKIEVRITKQTKTNLKLRQHIAQMAFAYFLPIMFASVSRQTNG